MIQAKLIWSSARKNPTGASSTALPAEWFNKGHSHEVSPTNVADLASSFPLAFTQSPKRVCRTPPFTPSPLSKAFVPRRRPVPASPAHAPEANRVKRRRKALTDTAPTDDLASAPSSSSSSHGASASSALQPNFMSPERVLCKDYYSKARAAACLFSPGQEAAERLIALRHAFSPCKQRSVAPL